MHLFNQLLEILDSTGLYNFLFKCYPTIYRDIQVKVLSEYRDGDFADFFFFGNQCQLHAIACNLGLSSEVKSTMSSHKLLGFFFSKSEPIPVNISCIILSNSFLFFSQPNTMSYKWETLKAMPSKRVFASPLVHEENLYIIGGCNERGIPLDCFEMFNTKQKKWHRLQNLPTKRAAPAVVASGTKIIAVGGVSESQHPLNAVEVYDIAEKKWTVVDPLGDKLLGISCVVRGEWQQIVSCLLCRFFFYDIMCISDIVLSRKSFG